MSIADQIVAQAQAQGVDPMLALEVATRESSLNPNARGAAGEIGLFQLMPATAASLGVDPTDVTQNIQGGISLLQQLLAKYGDPSQALAAYNMGEPKFDSVRSQWGSDWFAHIPASTQAYITWILNQVQTQYAASANPATSVPTLMPTTSLLTIPQGLPATAAPPSSGSVWAALAMAAALFLGLNLALNEGL